MTLGQIWCIRCESDMVETGSGSTQMAGFGINFVEPSGSTVVHGLRSCVGLYRVFSNCAPYARGI